MKLDKQKAFNSEKTNLRHHNLTYKLSANGNNAKGNFYTCYFLRQQLNVNKKWCRQARSWLNVRCLGVKAQQKERKNMKYVNQDEEEVNCISRLLTRRKKTLKCQSLKLFPMWFPSSWCFSAFRRNILRKYMLRVYVHTYSIIISLLTLFSPAPRPQLSSQVILYASACISVCWRHQHAMKLKLQSRSLLPSRARSITSFLLEAMHSPSSPSDLKERTLLTNTFPLVSN